VDSLLIANRGEIAVRIIRSARELGLRTIAVYSELDRDSLHVELADEAWNIGPAPATQSYLNVARIIEVARQAKADAIHPGYGFLAENAGFASQVAEAGMIFVGPPPEAIASMGDKITSRRAVEAAGVAGVPGTLQPVDSLAAAQTVAEQFGFPVAIKAAHGGGGKGLRVVPSPAQLEAGWEGARREADAYFGNPEVYVEKYLERPRHLEAQILFDHHGNGVFLGDRDCSTQRRHQKLLEEAPAPGLDPDLRKRLGQAALAVGEACGYRNAGTVEFLLDREGNLYFLEMNTRLQVEHTVTEMVLGIDLVRAQLEIAAGKPLDIEEVNSHGHAIQLRINAEDPGRDFFPSPGTIVDYREPAGPGVRIDSGVRAGSVVSQYYDNLIAKLVVWGADRSQAIDRAKRALGEFIITGVATTIPAHRRLLSNPSFLAASHHTRLVEDELDFSDLDPVAAPAAAEEEETQERQATVEVGGRRFVVRMWLPEVELPETAGQAPTRRRRRPRLERASSGVDAGLVTAPMQGTIVKVMVKAGDRVHRDQTLCVLEAMKMENSIKAPIEGEVVDLRVATGDSVAQGAVIAIVR